MKKIILMGLFCLALTHVFGQSNTYNIQIIDDKTQTPVSSATIYVKDLQAGFYTDDKGFVTIESDKADDLKIEVSRLGYETQNFDLLPGETTKVTIQPKSIIIEEILVDGIKTGKPAHCEVINDAVGKICQPRDIGDLFRDIPGFSLIKRGGYALDPVFRSFRSEQLNVQYDGGIQVMHACPNRMDPITTHVNPQEVERIEIVKGPFSVRFGQTMGGIMNVITRAPDQSDEFVISGSAEAGYESNGNSKLAHMQLNIADEGYDFSVGGGLRDYGNFQSGEGVEIPSSFKSYDYMVKGGFNPDSDQRIQLGWRQSFGRDILHAGLPMDTREDNSSIGTVDYVYNNIGSSLYSVTVKAFVSQVDHIMINELRPNFMMVDAVAVVDALTTGGKAELTFTPSEDHLLFTGIDFRHLDRSGDRNRLMKRNMMTGEPLDPPVLMIDKIWQDASQADLGFFLETKKEFGERWSVSGGLRLDYVASEIKDPAEDFKGLYPDLDRVMEINFGGFGSASYFAPNGWEMELSIGRGTRTANMEERFINHFQVGVDGFEYVGNPELRPEANHQIQFEIGKQTPKFILNATVFGSYLTDYIVGVVDSSITRKFMPMNEPRFAKRFINVDEAIQTGFEISTRTNVTDHLYLLGRASYTYANNIDLDEPLPEVAPLKSSFSVGYERKKWMIEATGNYSARQSRVSDTFGETETPEYFTSDVRAVLRPMNGLSLGFSVINCFDADYYDHLNRGFRNSLNKGRLFEPGRNISLFLKYDL